tara:strand:- start:1103 stop:1729 length:627 start_codon:yes stop_codon:yes gene_type:complete
MANKYNPFMYTQGINTLQSQTGAAGKKWEGVQMGLSREAIRKYEEEQAEKITGAASDFNLGSTLFKMLGTGLTLLNPSLKYAAGAATALGTKFLGDQVTSGLGYDDAPETLYMVDEAEEATSLAHGAIDDLISSVNPTAISSGFQAPLMGMSLLNMKTPNVTSKSIIDYLTKEGKVRAGDVAPKPDPFSILKNYMNPNSYKSYLFGGD